MRWFWGSKNADSEVVRDLDPSLREFLEKEKPQGQTAAPKPSPPSSLDAVKSLETQSAPESSSRPVVPKESLFQDGRYAHLWKTYRPLADIEAASKTDQDRMTDLVDSLSERKYQVRTAAIENCAMESMAIQDCYNKGGAWDRLTLCRAENRAFDRCFEMQAKFLKALGYMGAVGLPQDETERIQMHADALFRRMIEQERLRKEALEKGLPEPEYKPVMSRENIAGMMGAAMASSKQFDGFMDRVTPEARAGYEERLKDKNAEEQALEMRVIESELQSKVDHVQEVSDIFREEKKGRLQRKSQGSSTVGDRLKAWWGWDESEEK